MFRDFFLGFIKIHILHHAMEENICGVEIIDELKRHGYKISPGTLYPTLHSLEKSGYLKSHGIVENGRIRKYYRITSKGKRALEKSKDKMKELVKEVLA